MLIAELVDFLVLTPLPEEQKSLRKALKSADGTEETLAGLAEDADLNAMFFRLPRKTEGSEAVSVVVITIKEAGRVHAAVAVRAALQHWSPRCVLTVGIAGARPGQGLRIGDVVVPAKIVDYERKTVKKKATPKWATYDIPLGLREKVALPTKVPKWLAKLRTAVRGTDGLRVVREGVVLSGDKKIREGKNLRKLTDHWVEANSVEMEGSGVAAACDWPRVGKLPHLMIRGISDIVEEGGEPSNQGTSPTRRLASGTAAVAAVHFMRTVRGHPLDQGVETLPRNVRPPRSSVMRKCNELYERGYPVVLFGKAVDYVQLAIELSERAETFAFWLKNGTPLRWKRDLHASDSRELEWHDRAFEALRCPKLRLVVFRDMDELSEYEAARSQLDRRGVKPAGVAPQQKRIRDFESSCGGNLGFAILDGLPLPKGGTDSLHGLDIGYVSWSQDYEDRGFCFCSRFLSNNLAQITEGPPGDEAVESFSPIWVFNVQGATAWGDSVRAASELTWYALEFYRGVVRQVAEVHRHNAVISGFRSLGWYASSVESLIQKHQRRSR